MEMGNMKPPYPVPITGVPVTINQQASPFPGIKIVDPVAPPQPGQIISYYAILRPETGCCKCKNMTPLGYVSIILIAAFVTPCFAFIPCMMEDCFEKSQQPVYGYPSPPVGIPAYS